MVLYIIWISLSILLSLIGMESFLPYSEDETYPLFQDIAVILILYPSYFIFTFGIIPHLIVTYIKSKIIKTTFLLIILLSSLLYSLNFLEFYSLWIRLLLSFLFIGISYLYFIATFLIKNRMKDMNS